MTPSKTILITGCSTGFGRITALHFAKLGWRVFGTVRKEADQESLLREKKERGEIVPLICDVTNESQVQELGRAVAAQTPTLDALVNNAGSAFAAPLELLPPDVLREQFDLNVIAQLAVTQAVMPLLKAAKGTIINVSSIGGRITSPLLGAYTASKFALEAISDTLRVELAPFRVKVVVIEPGSSPTAIWETSLSRALTMLAERNIDSRAYAPLIERVKETSVQRASVGFPPQLFADTVEKILVSPDPQTRYPIPASVGWVIRLRRFAPDKWWDGLVRRRTKW
ncbi:MAG: SDR family oxidoreductase [Chloroflexi bacterium]|nr:SDR family oxidoreductase [Chloroflexota bacterium]